MKKAFKFIGIFLTIPFLLILFLGLGYWIAPEYIEQKALAFFSPSINIHPKYQRNITIENIEVYELLQIASSLTPTFQQDDNLVNKNTNYYKDFKQHFWEYQDHALIAQLEHYLKSDSYGPSQTAIKLLSLNYDIDDDGRLMTNNTFNVKSFLFSLFKSKAFLIPENTKLIDDFIAETNFKLFYQNHKPVYQKHIENYNKYCDFNRMKSWLEEKFSTSYNSYRIIFSPLTGGFHSTRRFGNKNKSASQTLMFVSAPDEVEIDSLDQNKFEIESSRMERMVFTEIDHNYVNPLTDQYLAKLDSSMLNYKDWNSQTKNMYASKYGTFNEYMTWGVFCLYALDSYSKENMDTIINKQATFISEHRKFHRFKDFKDELIKNYIKMNKPKIEDLYPAMLDWMKKNS